jgi:hypothetical protein
MRIGTVKVWISGPLAALSDGYASELTRMGYAPASVRLQMKVLADLSGWLLKRGMVAAELKSSDLARFLRDRRAAGHTRYVSSKAVRPVLDYLHRLEVVSPQIEDPVLGPVDAVLDKFRRYLTVERALATVTARLYLDMMRPFLQGRLSADGLALDLEV